MYNKIDIALDTFPYNGTTTTMQALYMSVPVISIQGNSHISRVTSSILHNLGLEELIANNFNEYIDLAVKLAHETKRIIQYKETIRSRMMNSILVDSEFFVRELESFYESLS